MPNYNFNQINPSVDKVPCDIRDKEKNSTFPFFYTDVVKGTIGIIALIPETKCDQVAKGSCHVYGIP
jgi:hypothetical protein